MSDELTVDVAVDNEGMSNDYFDNFEMVDDDGNPIEESSSSDQPKPEKTENVDNSGKQTGSEKPSGQSDSMPNGFIKRFFDTAEDGNPVLKSDDFHGFLYGENFKPNPWKPVERKFEQVQQQPNQNDPLAGVEPWRRPFVERENYAKQRADELLFPIQQIRESLGYGIDPQTKQFLDYQERMVREKIDKEMLPKWEYERQQKEQEQRAKDLERENTMKSVKSKSQANQSNLAQKMGGDDAYNEFFFGKLDQNGKHIPGPVTDLINYMFDTANPEKKFSSVEEYQKEYSDWWDQQASDPARLNYLYEVGKALTLYRNFPHVRDKFVTTTEKNLSEKKRAATMPHNSDSKTRAPKSNSGSETGFPELDRLLNGPE